MAYNSAYTGAQVDAAVGAVRNKETTWDSKQNALSGTEDQLVGFNASGEAAAVPMPSAANVGADPAGTAEEEISEHNASSSAHATLFSEKQDKITGQQGQIVGFDSSGNPIAQTAPDTGVVTFNGRSGAVAPQTGDYTADMVGARPNTWLPTVYRTATLSASAWSNNAQTVTVSGVSATETAQLIQPMPAMASQTAYYEAGILCTGQAANQLTFTCQTVPTADLTVYIVMQEVGA